MSREFTQREKVLMLVLVAVMLLSGYLKLFSEPLQAQVADAQSRQTEAQDAMLVEQVKLHQLQQMEAELEELKGSGQAQAAEIPDYDNIDRVMVELNTILTTAKDYELTFADLSWGDELISRPIQMTFTAGNYAAAKTILQNLYQCWYRCSLSDITVSGEEDVTRQEVTVSLTVTFFERNVEGAGAETAA